MQPKSFSRSERAHSILATLAADFIRAEANTTPLITVTNIALSPDGKRTTIFFTTIPDTGEADALVFLKRKASDFRAYIKKHSKLRTIPHIEFEIDRGERHRQHIDEIANNLD